MPRNAKPIDLHKKQGNPNRLTKADIKHREESEIKLGSKELLCPGYVKNDVTAFSKWREIKHIYKDVDFVSSGDIGLIGKYCMTHSEYIKLLSQKARIENFEIDYEQLLKTYSSDLLEGLDAFFRFGPVMQLDNAINKKMDMLIKMEDRLFLNPLAKVKNVPKKEEKKVNPLEDKGFGNV